MATVGDPLVGRTIAHYDILSRAGGGGMGVVYRARDTRLGRTVALKFLPPQWSHDEDARQRFIREAQAASATHHHNICTVHDIETADDGQLFIVMAFYEGQTLKQRLESGRLPVEEALDIASQIADGLAKAHAQGVVHRDIKPGNVMLTEDGVRILDFGLATFADSVRLTLENTTLGTVAYMSPEQVRGQSADARSDVWAVGVVLYEMLTGRVPFQGSHPEAIAYAVRNEAPEPVRTLRPEVTEEVEQLVFRALHKEPSVRYASGLDLARAMRRVRGQSLPIDLRTEHVTVNQDHEKEKKTTKRRPALRIAAALAVGVAGLLAWVMWPVERVPLAIALAQNQSGYAELNRYKSALTYVLADALATSSAARPVPYLRFLEVTRASRLKGASISSQEMLQALATHSGARIVIVPIVVQEAGVWKARAEVRDGKTATMIGTVETAPIVSTLERETAERVMADLAVAIEQYLVKSGPLRASLVAGVRGLWRPRGEAPPTIRPLDAATAFEAGLDAYERLEYDEAFRAFTEAARLSRHPLAESWRSRTARLMRHDQDASEAAVQSLRLMAEPIRPGDRLFIEAVAAEARLDFPTAEARYRALVEADESDAFRFVDLAGFLDRRGRTADAIAAYQQALTLDGALARPEIELCRLHNRQNERPQAIERGRRALSKHESLGNATGTAQAMMCLADGLALGNEQDRSEARRYADSAAETLGTFGATYNLARANYYVAMIAGLQGQLPDAVTVGQRALVLARQSGNAVLEPIVLMNLGVANARMRRATTAIEYYRQSSVGFETLGDERRAAQNHLNAGWVAMDYGVDLEGGRRDIQAALAVFESLGDSNFEVSCRHALAMYNLARGRYADAETQMNRALELARDRGLGETMSTLLIDSALVQFEQADYEHARATLTEAVGDGQGPDAPRALIRRAQVLARVGEFAAAESDLRTADGLLKQRGNRALDALVQLVRGEAAYQADDRSRARLALTAAAEASGPGAETLDPAGVEAQTYLAMLAAASGEVASGRRFADQSLAQARSMGRLAIEAKALIAQARVGVAAGRWDEAEKALGAMEAAVASNTLGPELRAQADYWRSVILRARGDGAGATRLIEQSRRILDEIQMRLTDAHRATFVRRADVRQIVTDVRNRGAAR